jgi:hypothetical protein
MFGFFDVKQSEEFGQSLADLFMERIPAFATSSGEKSQTKKLLSAINKLHQQIEQFKREHKLNFYQKAKLLNTFKWQLLSSGYDKIFVDEVTQGLALKL